MTADLTRFVEWCAADPRIAHVTTAPPRFSVPLAEGKRVMVDVLADGPFVRVECRAPFSSQTTQRLGIPAIRSSVEPYVKEFAESRSSRCHTRLATNGGSVVVGVDVHEEGLNGNSFLLAVEELIKVSLILQPGIEKAADDAARPAAPPRLAEPAVSPLIQPVPQPARQLPVAAAPRPLAADSVGTRIESVPAGGPRPATCPSCNARIAPGIKFCTACGAPVGAAEPARGAVAPGRAAVCTQCGEPLTPGTRFCTSCGSPATPAGAGAPALPPRPAAPRPGGVAAPLGDRPRVTAAPSAAGQTSASEVLKGVSALSLAVAVGFALAIISTFFSWVSVPGISFSAWDGNSRFQFADWISVTMPLDALIVLAIAAGGALLLIVPLFGRSVPRIPYATLIAGAALALIGVLEFLYVKRVGHGVSVGFGVFLLIGAGALAAVCSYVEDQRTKESIR